MDSLKSEHSTSRARCCTGTAHIISGSIYLWLVVVQCLYAKIALLVDRDAIRAGFAGDLDIPVGTNPFCGGPAAYDTNAGKLLLL